MSFARTTLVLSLLVLLGWTAKAAASASPAPPPPPPPLAALGVTGPGVVRDATVEVDCEDVSEALPAARCVVVARFELLAVDALELRDVRSRPGVANRFESRPNVTPVDDHVWVDGAPIAEVRMVAAGESVHVELSTTRVLSSHPSRRGYDFFVPPMRLRHVFFGGGLQTRQVGESLRGRLVEGDTVRVQGGMHVAVRVPDMVRVRVDGTALQTTTEVDGAHLALDVTLDPPWEPPTLVEQGGPWLALGARFPRLDSNGHARFFLRVGYEWGIARYLFASGSVASDFESLLESVVVEAASPLLLLLPGVTAGVGVVARQLGPGRADAALRLRVGANLPVLGVTADFDYWPSRRVWTGTIAARLSL